VPRRGVDRTAFLVDQSIYCVPAITGLNLYPNTRLGPRGGGKDCCLTVGVSRAHPPLLAKPAWMTDTLASETQ